MKLRNKKTGVIVEPFGITCVNGRTFVQFDEKGTFKFEEPKDHYCIDYDGDIMVVEALDYEPKIKEMKQIGNYFSSREEAKLAVRKLKAWKRLEDKGFRFCGWATNDGISSLIYDIENDYHHNYRELNIVKTKLEECKMWLEKLIDSGGES